MNQYLRFKPGRIILALLVGGAIRMGWRMHVAWATPAQAPHRQTVPTLSPTPAATKPPSSSSGAGQATGTLALSPIVTEPASSASTLAAEEPAATATQTSTALPTMTSLPATPTPGPTFSATPVPPIALPTHTLAAPASPTGVVTPVPSFTAAAPPTPAAPLEEQAAPDERVVPAEAVRRPRLPWSALWAPLLLIALTFGAATLRHRRR